MPDDAKIDSSSCSMPHTPHKPPVLCTLQLQALNKRGGAPFTNRDEHVLKLFSMHLGNTLAKARLHEEAE